MFKGRVLQIHTVFKPKKCLLIESVLHLFGGQNYGLLDERNYQQTSNKIINIFFSMTSALLIITTFFCIYMKRILLNPRQSKEKKDVFAVLLRCC